jgi:hypothetical protein
MNKEFAGAIIAFQKEIKNIERNATNPFFSSSRLGGMYADLDVVTEYLRPLLSKHNMAVIQSVGEYRDNCASVVTTLIHSSGELIDRAGSCPVAKQDPQGTMSAITYLRRYGIMAITGLAAQGEDDDGNKASGKNGQEKTPLAKKQKSPVTPAPTSMHVNFSNIVSVQEKTTAKNTPYCAIFYTDELGEEKVINTFHKTCAVQAREQIGKGAGSFEYVLEKGYKNAIALLPF